MYISVDVNFEKHSVLLYTKYIYPSYLQFPITILYWHCLLFVELLRQIPHHVNTLFPQTLTHMRNNDIDSSYNSFFISSNDTFIWFMLIPDITTSVRAPFSKEKPAFSPFSSADICMRTIDKPTASLSASIRTVAWMAILLNRIKYICYQNASPYDNWP